MENQKVFYVENEHGGIVDYMGLPWATSVEELAWFVAYGMHKRNPQLSYSVQAFHREVEYEGLKMVWQRDPLYATHHLGYAHASSKSTIGNYGCVVCSFAMGLQILTGKFYTPMAVNKRMVDISGFGGDTHNLFVWERGENAYPDIKFDAWIISEEIPAQVERMKKHLEGGGICISQVDFNTADRKVQSHYLLVTEISDDLQTGTAADPWTGRMITIPPAYINPAWKPFNFGRAIMRTAFYSKA